MFTQIIQPLLVSGFSPQVSASQAKTDSPVLDAAREGLQEGAEHAKSLGEMTLTELCELGQYQAQQLIQGDSIDRLRWILIGALSLLVLLVGVSLLSALIRKVRPRNQSRFRPGQQRPDLPHVTWDMLGEPGSLGFIPLGISLDHLQQSSSRPRSSEADDSNEIDALQSRVQSLEKMLTDLSQQANKPVSDNRNVQGNSCASPTAVRDNSRVERPFSGERLPSSFARGPSSSSSSLCGADELGQGRFDDTSTSQRSREPDQLSLDIVAENLLLKEAVSSIACQRSGDDSDRSQWPPALKGE